MSSRQQEKERRRQERLAAEAEAAQASARRRRMGLAVGGVLAGVAVAAVVIAVVASGGGSKSSKKPSQNAANTAATLQAKAAAAGCTVQTAASEGRNHTTSTVHYKTNPPTSGNHYPEPASDGIYDPGGTPPVTHLVHALEHGRVEFQYKPGLPAAEVQQLQQLMKEPVTVGGSTQSGGFLQLFFQNATGMPYQVAAASWTHLIGCPTFKGQATLDALRSFRAAYINKAPEQIPVPE